MCYLTSLNSRTQLSQVLFMLWFKIVLESGVLNIFYTEKWFKNTTFLYSACRYVKRL